MERLSAVATDAQKIAWQDDLICQLQAELNAACRQLAAKKAEASDLTLLLLVLGALSLLTALMVALPQAAR